MNRSIKFLHASGFREEIRLLVEPGKPESIYDKLITSFVVLHQLTLSNNNIIIDRRCVVS